MKSCTCIMRYVVSMYHLFILTLIHALYTMSMPVIRVVLRDVRSSRPLGRWHALARLAGIRKEYAFLYSKLLKVYTLATFIPVIHITSVIILPFSRHTCLYIPIYLLTFAYIHTAALYLSTLSAPMHTYINIHCIHI